MRKISIELIPHSYSIIAEAINYIDDFLPMVNVINIPDISRLDIRSWEATAHFKKKRKVIIPHIRAIDFSPEKTFILKSFFTDNKIDEIIIVNGDKIASPHKKTFYEKNTSIVFAQKIKKEIPGIKIYGAIDPYRFSFKQEYEYMIQKTEAGFDGFFTQPIFDLRLLEIYSNMCQGHEVFWGIAPVTSERSQKYWENFNNVIFPNQFKLTLKYNIDFARQAMEIAATQPFYFMPIKVDIKEYFSQIFN